MEYTMLFVELRHKVSLLTKVSTELSDNDFREGWRFSRHLKNSEVDYVKYVSEQQEFNDKTNNESFVAHDEIQYNQPNDKTLFHNCDGWRYV